MRTPDDSADGNEAILARVRMSSSNGETEGLDEWLHVTFAAMEKRRLQRQASGRQVARGIWTLAMEAAMFLGFSMYGLASLRRSLLGQVSNNPSYLFVPCALTAGVFGTTMHQSVVIRENLGLLWGKAWGWMLIIWALWLYDPSDARCPHSGEPQPWYLLGSSTAEHWVFFLFLGLEGATFVLWLVFTKLYPYLVQTCQSPGALRWFWRIRRASRRPGWSYMPNGFLCSVRRKHFHYEGERFPEGPPNGHGVWQDDSYHGEVLDGQWNEGIPVAPFVSRVFGRGAISIGLSVGYCTARAEGLKELFWKPRRAEGGVLSIGVVGVECSAAGGFLGHLPQLVEGQHKRFETVSAMVTDLRGTSAAVLRRASSCGIEFYRVPASLSIVASVAAAAITGEEHLESIPRAPEFLLAAGAAVIFVHGFNCPLDWACMRLGQLMTLGKFGPDVMPIVFSWPSGKLFSYFDVQRKLPQFAPDLARVISALRAAGVQQIHMIAHSMGCELVTTALPQIAEVLAASKSNLTGGTGEAGTAQRPRLPSITFCNATNTVSSFLGEDRNGDVKGLLRICNRLTLYCDREDYALRGAELLGRRGVTIGRQTEPIGYGTELSARVDVVDCTAMDANVNGIRHSYFDLNTHVVCDIQELVCTGKPAAQRSRLVRAAMDRRTNVFAFLAPPVFVNW